MHLSRILALSFILLAPVYGQTDSKPKGMNTGAGLAVEYIANEGILIKSGSKTILLDAIHRSYKPAYAFTPEEVLQKIESARYPYNKIDLILVSHHHLDHFHAGSIAKHLWNSRKSVIASSPQVITAVESELESLSSGYGSQRVAPDRLKKIDHVWKKTGTYEDGDLKVRLLGMRHANSELAKFKDIQNFGHLIEIAGKKLLHLGDADMFAENFTAFELEKEEIDIAFVPYWFMLSAKGRAILKNQINARTYIAVHVPPTEQSAAIRNILGAMPSAKVFSQPGEMLSY